MRWKLSIACTLACMVAVPASAQVDLGAPMSSFMADAIGYNDRNVIFRALSDFTVGSAGIRVDPNVTGDWILEAGVYSMTSPTSTRTLLTSATKTFSDAGLGFYDVPIFASFLAGSYYSVGFRNLSYIDSWGWGRYDMELYNFHNGSYTVAGMVEVLDGGAGGGSFAGAGNTVMPHVRFDGGAVSTVPEPASMLLLGAGLFGIGFVALRRRREGGLAIR